VDENQAQKIRADLALKLFQNPKTKASFTKLIKEVDPSFESPVGDIEELRNEIKNHKEEMTIQTAAREEQRNREKARAKIKAKYDDSAMKVIEEEIMPKYGISDYEAASKIYDYDLPKPKKEPGAMYGARWTMPAIDELISDPAGWAKSAAIDEVEKIMARREGNK